MRLLVVEDEPHLADGLREGLEAEGFAVDVAADGSEGLRLGLAGEHAAIVLDLMLPRLDGYRVCSALRAAGLDTPVLVLTAREGERDEVTALETGADDFLTKPFSHAVLVARLRALLRRRTSDEPDELAVGDLRMDPAARTVWRGGTEVRLTAREHAVLEHLMRRAGRVVTKRELLDEVWDPYVEIDPNIVEVYLRRLRNKVDRPFGRSSLQTLRGAGYRLSADGTDGTDGA
ncbi:response regulator transcription factor [Aquipuribacter nitratireducens]|uniref:Response regulator transcription factor n=1 Tax=Aquipuribacter nitratireducens TaxID=650104 RepID=A0ABW0GRH6_9MICO